MTAVLVAMALMSEISALYFLSLLAVGPEWSIVTQVAITAVLGCFALSGGSSTACSASRPARVLQRVVDGPPVRAEVASHRHARGTPSPASEDRAVMETRPALVITTQVTTPRDDPATILAMDTPRDTQASRLPACAGLSGRDPSDVNAAIGRARS